VPGVMTGLAPVSAHVPTFRAARRPIWASAPFRAWAQTTPGLGPELPHVMLSGRRLGEVPVVSGSCQETGITKAPALQFDMEYLDLDIGTIDPQVMEMMPESMMQEYQIIPLDLESVDASWFRLNMDLDCVLVAREQAQAVISGYMEQKESESVDLMLQGFTSTDVQFEDRGEKSGDQQADAAPIFR